MMYDDKCFIGQKIKNFRRKRNLTQAELAEKVDLSEKHISKIEAGTHLPSLQAFFKIIEILNIGLEEFGLALVTEQNPERQELLKYIYSSTDEELKFLLPVIKCINENLKRNKSL